MTGPEHYRAAEKLLGYMSEEVGDWELAAAAQVHATLALAAATALAYGWKRSAARVTEVSP